MALTIIAPVAAADPSLSPSADPALVVTMAQSGLSYNATTNRAQIRVTITPSGAAAPWRYSVAVRGTTVTSGTSSA